MKKRIKINSFFTESMDELNKIVEDRDILYEDIVSITECKIYGFNVFYIEKENPHL